MANATFGVNILPKDNTVTIGNSDTGKQWTIVSPSLTGTPTAPTATSGTSTTQIATTAFVMNAFQATEYSSISDFPVTGVAGRIYIAKDTNLIYRWDATEGEYINIGGSGESTLYPVSLSIATTDWTAVTGGYSATVTNSNIVADSVEFVIYDSSILNLTSGISTSKNGTTHTYIFTVDSVPSDTITGTLYILKNGNIELDTKLDKNQGSANAGKFMKVGNDGELAPETVPIPSDMTGATSGAAGTHGLVPAPSAGDDGKFLKGDGTWGNPLPTPPVNDGTYILQCLVSSGVATYSWVTLPPASGVSF